MKKRQIKKNLKKHVKFYPVDEAVILLYTKEELEDAQEKRRKQSYRIAKMGYKRIKRLGVIKFFYPPAQKRHAAMMEITKRMRKSSLSPHVAMQSLSDMVDNNGLRRD